MDSKKKLVLIDGHSILNRAFYGVPDLTNAAGLHTNAIYGFLNIMFKVLDEENPDYFIVAFDVKEKTFRHKMFEEYKGTRKPMPSELHEQVPVIQEVLKAMNITVVTMPGYEADDILGTLAKRAESAGNIVRVISGDRDLLQLATNNIMIRIPKTKKTGTEIENYLADDVYEKYQVTPLEFIDLKALMGDASDNIPGVRGIGEKTASKIITKYHSIENAYEHVDELMPKKAAATFKEEYEIAQLSKKLATINIDVPLEVSYEEGTIDDMFNSNSYDLISELGFKSILKKFKDTKSNVTVFDSEEISIELKDFNTLKNTLESFDSQQIIGVYIAKHKSNSHGEGQMVLSFLQDDEESSKKGTDDITIAFSDGNKIYSILEPLSVEGECLELLKNFLNSHIIAVSGLKNILKIINFESTKVLDLELISYLINPLKSEYTFEDYSVISGIKIPQNLTDNKKLEELKKEDRHKYIMSTNTAAYVLCKTAAHLKDRLNELNMWSLYEDIELPLVYALNNMENVGVKVDGSLLKEYSGVLKEGIDRLEQEIYAETGEEFNINSPKQLGEVLFEKMQLPGSKKTKSGYSTAADVLEKLSDEYPVVQKILYYRQLTKLKSTYADGLVNFIGEDGRIHGKFNQTITATGRISSTDPNLQNIPIRMELGRQIRKVFVPEEGYSFIDADYSQIELRILAHMSEDESLIEAYKSAKDIHLITAAKVFGVPEDEVTKELRGKAKAVNFGIVYGISSFGLSQDLKVSRKEASEYIEQYFATYPGVKRYLDNCVDSAKEKGYVTTLFNRIRPIPELKSSNFMQRSFGERIAMNSPIQGTAADIMKIAMINVERAIRKKELHSRIVLQVHDELLVETFAGEEDIIKEILVNEMSRAADLKVNLEIGVECGKNWLEAH
ncbi:MAG: DNA polymerase I [Clostridiales bacterium]|nr:DNA polymerase I [Clostridiales bacterium]